MGFGVEEPWPLTLNSSLWRSSSLVTFDPAWGHVYCQHIPHILSPWLPGVHMSDWLRAEFREEDISPSCFQNKSIIGLFRGKQNTFICNGLLLYCVLLVLLEHNQELLDLLEDSGVDPTKPSDSYNIFKTPLNTPGNSPGTSSRIHRVNVSAALSSRTPGWEQVKCDTWWLKSETSFLSHVVTSPIQNFIHKKADLLRQQQWSWSQTKQNKEEEERNFWQSERNVLFTLCLLI